MACSSSLPLSVGGLVGWPLDRLLRRSEGSRCGYRPITFTGSGRQTSNGSQSQGLAHACCMTVECPCSLPTLLDDEVVLKRIFKLVLSELVECPAPQDVVVPQTLLLWTVLD